jgi:hypothetical protein
MKGWVIRTVVMLMCFAGSCRFLMGQGCGVVMTRNYNTYYSSSSDGSHIYTSVTVDGSATCSPTPSCPCNTAQHTPNVQNQVSTVGGWLSGSPSCVSCYVSLQTNQTLVANVGTIATLTWDGQITCSIAGTFYSSGGSTSVASYTSIQHNYPRNPLPQPCWISQFFDLVINGSTHHAQDVVNSNSSSNGGLATPYGTPVYASEGGTVAKEASGNGPAAGGYPSCVGKSSPTNFVKIKNPSDGYYTVYAHVTPTVANGATVTAGQQIGVTDNSGCQSAGTFTWRARTRITIR